MLMLERVSGKWTLKQFVHKKTARREQEVNKMAVNGQRVVFFILHGLIWANPDMYPAILFYQPGKKFGLFFTRW